VSSRLEGPIHEPVGTAAEDVPSSLAHEDKDPLCTRCSVPMEDRVVEDKKWLIVSSPH
jgi:hypothetical protein